MGRLNDYHLKAVRSKMLRNTILFPFTNFSSGVFSHSRNRCHFWKCRIAKRKKKKKSASFKNTVVLYSYLLVENMCVLNTNYLFSSVFSLENKNFLLQLQSTNKMVSQKSNRHLGTSCLCYFVIFPLTLWVLNKSEHSGMWLGLHVCARARARACALGLFCLYWGAAWSRWSGVRLVPALLLTSCVTLGNLFKFSKLHFPHPQNSCNNICLMELLWELRQYILKYLA